MSPGQAAAAMQGPNKFVIEVKVHPFLNFKASESSPYRASFQNIHGYIYGVELVNENVDERFNFYRMMKDGLGFDPYKIYENAMNQSQQTIHFFNVLKNRTSEHVKRGAIVKALAFGCRQKWLLEAVS